MMITHTSRLSFSACLKIEKPTRSDVGYVKLMPTTTIVPKNSAASLWLESIMRSFSGSTFCAGAGLLFAPQSGAWTRRRFRHLAHDLQDKAEDLVDEVQHAAGTVLDKVGA